MSDSKLISNSLPFTVFFDIGDTLVNAREIIKKASYYASCKCKESGCVIDPIDFYSSYLEADCSIHKLHMNHVFGNRLIVLRAIELHDADVDSHFVPIFLTYYREMVRNMIMPNSNIEVLFRALSNIQGIRLGVISDGSHDEQLETLVRLGVIKYFDSNLIFISEDLGQEKTSSSIFEECARRGKTETGKCCMIGDNIERDILYAQDAGMRTILFTAYANISSDNYEKVNPDFVCSSFDDIGKVIGSITSNVGSG